MNASSDQPKRVEIELEPLPLAGDAADAPDGDAHDFGFADAINHPPVPDYQAHLCPDCGYDLRSLRSRNCPECGAPFTVAEARAAGREAAPVNKEDRLAIRVEQFCWFGGVGIYIAFIVAPMIVKGSTTWGLFMSGFAILQLCGATIYKVTFDRSWAEALFLSGILFAIFSGTAMYAL